MGCLICQQKRIQKQKEREGNQLPSLPDMFQNLLLSAINVTKAALKTGQVVINRLCFSLVQNFYVNTFYFFIVNVIPGFNPDIPVCPDFNIIASGKQVQVNIFCPDYRETLTA